MSAPQIKVRLDLNTCEQFPPLKVNVKFPEPLKQLWSELPAIDVIPYYSTKTETAFAVLHECHERYLESAKKRDPKKVKLIMSLIQFTGSALLHVFVVWLYHRYKHPHPTTALRCGLFCPKKPKATRRSSCPEGDPEISDALSPVDIPVHDYSVKVQKFSQAQSDQSLHATSN